MTQPFSFFMSEGVRIDSSTFMLLL